MKAVLMIVLMAIMNVCSQGQSVHARTADRLYKEKKFSASVPEYEKAVAEDAEDPVLQYNLGDAYFRNQQFDQAEKAYDKPVATNTDPSLQQQALYNKGVSFSKEHQLEKSIDAYKAALLMNPADNDARVNLQKALLEIKKKQEPEKEKKDQPQNQQQKKSNPPPQSKLNKKQVDQLLRALDQREQQVQQKMMQNRARGVTKPDKDW